MRNALSFIMACVVATPTAQAFSTNITAFYDVVDTIVTTNYKNAKDNGYYLNSTLQVMSPQTASMVMYDNIPVMQNTGRLDISIPMVVQNSWLDAVLQIFK